MSNEKADATDELVELTRHMVVRYEDTGELPTEFAERLIAAILGHKRVNEALQEFVTFSPKLLRLWCINEPNGWSTVDLDSGDFASISFSQSQDCPVKDYVDSIKCEGDDCHVIHFALSNDVGIFELIEQKLAQRLEFQRGFIAVEYRQGVKGYAGRFLGPKQPRSEALIARAIVRHSRFSVKDWQNIKASSKALDF